MRENPLPQPQQGRGVGELALNAIGNGRKAGTDVSDDLGLREVDLLHRRRSGANMDDLRSTMAHQERGFLDGIMAD